MSHPWDPAPRTVDTRANARGGSAQPLDSGGDPFVRGGQRDADVLGADGP